MSTQSDDYVSGARETLLWLRAVIDNQVEARTAKPARIEEPGQWGVVKAGWPDNLGPTCHWVRDEYGWTTHGGRTASRRVRALWRRP